MPLAEKQSSLVEKYALLPDPQERLTAIVGKRRRLEPLRPTERTDARLVPGCVSRVWVTGEVRDGILRLRVDGESALVAGLAAFVAEFFDGEPAAAVATFPFTLLDDLRITAQLTPTRANGLGRIVDRIREIAAAA